VVGRHSVAPLMAAYLVILLFVLGAASSSSGIPSFPVIYQGTVTVAGAPAPDGTKIVAHIEDYSTHPVQAEERTPVLVRDGRYANLTVGPTDSKYLDKQITFHIQGAISTEQAIETDMFVEVEKPTVKSVDLTFSRLPPVPTPIPPFVGDVSPGKLPHAALLVGVLALCMGLLRIGVGARDRGGPS
jgi:hypothetical protein